MEITDINQLKQVEDFYRSTSWPQHLVGYYCIRNFRKWLEKGFPVNHCHCYTLPGVDLSVGLLAIVHRYQLFIYTLNDDNLHKLLELLMHLNWSDGVKVSSFHERFRPVVHQVVKNKNLSLEYDSLTLLYYMSNSKARQLSVDCPEGFYLKPLSTTEDNNHAKIVDKYWPNRHKGSLFLLARLIEWNPSIGLFQETTDELVAWCVRLQGGFLGALQVKDNYQRRGFGSVVTRAIARAIADEGDDVIALVGDCNHASRGMFTKLGFEVIDRCYWLRTFPLDLNKNWPDNQ